MVKLELLEAKHVQVRYSSKELRRINFEPFWHDFFYNFIHWDTAEVSNHSLFLVLYYMLDSTHASFPGHGIPVATPGGDPSAASRRFHRNLAESAAQIPRRD